MKNDDASVVAPTRISMLTNINMGSPFSIFQPKMPLDIADVVTVSYTHLTLPTKRIV